MTPSTGRTSIVWPPAFPNADRGPERALEAFDIDLGLDKQVHVFGEAGENMHRCRKPVAAGSRGCRIRVITEAKLEMWG